MSKETVLMKQGVMCPKTYVVNSDLKGNCTFMIFNDLGLDEKVWLVSLIPLSFI